MPGGGQIAAKANVANYMHKAVELASQAALEQDAKRSAQLMAELTEELTRLKQDKNISKQQMEITMNHALEDVRKMHEQAARLGIKLPKD